jgi:hypothetical protein
MEKFLDGDLPAAKRGTGRGSKWDADIEVLQANPDRWALMLETESRSKASGVYRTLTKRYEGLQCATRSTEVGFAVYAKFVGDAPDPE